MKFFPYADRLTKALLAGLVLSPLAVAHAQTLGITYYTIASSDPDANALCWGLSTNEVMNTLGPDGLPVLNPSATLTGGKLPTDLNGAGELTYWSPSFNSKVTETSIGTVTL